MHILYNRFFPYDPAYCSTFQWRIQDFPIAGAWDLIRGGRGPPEVATFQKFLHVKTKRIWTRRGGGACRARPPLDPPMLFGIITVFS